MFNTQTLTQTQPYAQQRNIAKTAKKHNTQKQKQKQYLKQCKIKKMFYKNLNNNYITL